MTRNIIIFHLIFLISACRNKIEISNNKSETETVFSDSVIPFHGFWATEKYISSLKKTKSPRLSQEDGMFFQIPKSYKHKTIFYIYHEGGAEFHIVKRKDFYYLKDEYNKNDSSEIVVLDNGKKLRIWDKIYIRMQENIGIPEDLLFKGSYKLGEKRVSFNADGTILGLDSIKYYSIQNDYIGPGMDAVDILYLGKTEKEKLAYCFNFKLDTLFINDVDCKEMDENGICMDIQKGQLKWTLIKE